MNLYIGNLSYNLEETELEEEFKAYGEVKSVKIIKDRETGNSKGLDLLKWEPTKKVLLQLRP